MKIPENIAKNTKKSENIPLNIAKSTHKKDPIYL
jgi:hypothetical protein